MKHVIILNLLCSGYGNLNKNFNVKTLNFNLFAFSITHLVYSIGHRKYLGRRSFHSLIPFLCWSKSVKQFAKKHTTNIHPIGAPFIYLHQINKNKKYNPKGTLVFPSHSTPEINVQIQHKKLIDIVEREEEGPYTVCLYYTDYKKKNINFYKKKNGM